MKMIFINIEIQWNFGKNIENTNDVKNAMQILKSEANIQRNLVVSSIDPSLVYEWQ